MALPKVGVQAVLILKDFERQKRQYEKALNDMQLKTEQMSRGVQGAVKNTAKSFDELTDKSQAMATSFRSLKLVAQDAIGDDLRKQFDDLAEGAAINVDKFDELIASGTAYEDAFTGAITTTEGAAASFSLVAVAITTATVALTTSIKVIRESLDAYEDLGREVRRVQLELGVSTREASAWVSIAQSAGVSTSAFNRAMTQLSRNIINYRIATLAGEEVTSNFAKGISALNIDLEKQNGTLKSAAEVFAEVQQRVQEAGPGTAALGEANNVLGLSTRQLVEILFDESFALETSTERLAELGALMGELDKKQTRELTASTNDLTSAWTGLHNFIARTFSPGATALQTQLAELINRVRIFAAETIALGSVAIDLVAGQIRWADASAVLAERQKTLLTGTTAALEKEAELERERARLANETLILAEAEEKLAAKRQKVLDQLDELNTKLAQREEDINRRFDDQLEDLRTRQSRDQITRSLKLTASLEDIYIKRGIRLRELEFKWVNNIDKIQRDQTRKIEEFQKDAARAREKIAVKHRENLIKIENRFYDTVDEAARTNDTVAVVRAIRQRNRSLRDETRRFTVEQDELEKDLRIKRDKINEAAEERKQEQINRDAEERARIERLFRDEIDALNRKNQRELVLTRRKDEERRQDIERNRARALRDAGIHYNREEAALQEHLAGLQVIVSRGIQNTAIAAAKHAENGISLVATAAANAIAAASQDFIGGGFNNPAISDFYEEWLRRPKKNPRAHGGLDIVNRPTTFTAGEAGAEIAAFIPLSQNRNINHSFGKLPIDFQGLPGGTDTGQVESIVYSAMIELARVLGTSRR